MLENCPYPVKIDEVALIVCDENQTMTPSEVQDLRICRSRKTKAWHRR